MHISTIRDISIIVFVASTMAINLGAYVRGKLMQRAMRKGKRK